MGQNETQILKGDVMPVNLSNSLSNTQQLSRRMMQLNQWNSESDQQIYALIQTDA